MDTTQFHQEVCRFLKELDKDLVEDFPAELGPDDNLFDLGLVTSFTIIRLIVFVEELTGQSIDLAEHDLENFYTLRGLYDLAQAGAGAEC